MCNDVDMNIHTGLHCTVFTSFPIPAESHPEAREIFQHCPNTLEQAGKAGVDGQNGKLWSADSNKQQKSGEKAPQADKGDKLHIISYNMLHFCQMWNRSTWGPLEFFTVSLGYLLILLNY